MKTTNHTKALATRLSAAAHMIAEEHGDVVAQAAAYAYLLRRWDTSIDVQPLIAEISGRAVDSIGAVLDEVDAEAVRAAYEAQGKDPAIYFYEVFLRAYDSAGARSRGVHYSPPEVVSGMVRGADFILRRELGCSLDEAVVIDPCCGVGTFLRHIERETRYRPRMIGMEIMPAAHAIASCLIPSAAIVQADWLSEEDIGFGEGIPLIIGNPPYSGHSSNPGKMAQMMGDYRDGLGERNPKWLQDDYVKFVRMAQHRIERAGRGVVAFITNHSYLTNPTFRGMRESLGRTFDQILVLDMHGNIKRQDGKHQNIFPIQMGVAISFFVKTSERTDCDVRYFSIEGTRDDKLRTLSQLDLNDVPWSEAPAVGPLRVFTPSNAALSAQFYSYASLFDIFGENTIGFVTSRDRFAIGFTREEVLERISALRGGKVSDEELRERYGVGDLDIEAARSRLLRDPDWQSKAIEVMYRPFDRRWAYYSRAVMERPRLPFIENLMAENVALAVGRAGNVTGSEEWDVVFCTDRPADLNLFRRGGAKLFPRYVCSGSERLSNISLACADPDALFAYIYALLHSTAYRTRYADLLRIDYPRVPITEDAHLFSALAEVGMTLLEVHLMRSHPAPSGEASTRIGGYELPAKTLRDRAGVDSRVKAEFVKRRVDKHVELRWDIDRIVNRKPPWKP